jgi:hypothetical protein
MGDEKKKKHKLFNNYQIIHNAYFDLYGLLGGIAKFFDSNQYDFRERGISDKATDIGAEMKSEWEASREVTDYFKFNMDIRVYARDIRKAQLENGEEVYWARLWITFNCELEKNWNDSFSDEKWSELMRQLYERYLIRSQINRHKGKLYNESVTLIDTMKTYLK